MRKHAANAGQSPGTRGFGIVACEAIDAHLECHREYNGQALILGNSSAGGESRRSSEATVSDRRGSAGTGLKRGATRIVQT